MKNIYMHLGKIVLAMAIFFVSFHASAQLPDSGRKVKVAVLVPLYLDSAFNGPAYKLGNNNLPQYLLPGLDFYNGVAMAIDSLQQEGQQLEVMIHDTKSRDKSLSLLLVEPEIADASFIIGSFTNVDELRKVAAFADSRNIPLISATYPNDGGISSNENLILLNPTLNTHVEGLFKYVQRNYSLDHLVMYARKGDAMDKYIMESFMEASRRYPQIPTRISYIEVSNAFNAKEIIAKLDSTKKNVIIAATLNETFAANIVRTLSGVKNSYQSVTIGMPTWDKMKELNRGDTRGVEVVYSTPYNFQKSDKVLGRLAAIYKQKLHGRASDMMFKGFETMYHFTRLYLKHQDSFTRNLSDRSFRISSDFDVQPAKARKDSPGTDYLENKKLYFVTRLDGVVKSTN